jgi:hypothetical protein
MYYYQAKGDNANGYTKVDIPSSIQKISNCLMILEIRERAPHANKYVVSLIVLVLCPFGLRKHEGDLDGFSWGANFVC